MEYIPMTNEQKARRLARIAHDHGFRSFARTDGTAVVTIPWTRNGCRQIGEIKIHCRTLGDMGRALGY